MKRWWKRGEGRSEQEGERGRDGGGGKGGERGPNIGYLF